MIGKPQMIIEDNPAEVAFTAAKIFTVTCRESISDRGHFAVALTGGTTPRPLHRMLGKEPYRSEIRWDKTDIFWVDERCVSEHNPASNYGTAKFDFLDKVPVPRRRIHPVPSRIPPEQAASSYEAELMDSFGIKRGEFPTFDLIFLGVGEDGHVASLFPGESSSDEGDRLVKAVTGGDPYLPRITMTYPVLDHARRILFLATGAKKAPILKAVFEDSQVLVPAKRAWMSNRKSAWIIDRDAGSLLSEETFQ